MYMPEPLVFSCFSHSFPKFSDAASPSLCSFAFYCLRLSRMFRPISYSDLFRIGTNEVTNAELAALIISRRAEFSLYNNYFSKKA